MTKNKKYKCSICGKEISESKLIQIEVYKSPYSRKPQILNLCSEKCQFKISDSYKKCNECNRWIKNIDGKRKRNFEIIDDGYPVCWKCYEKLDYEKTLD